MAFAPAWPARPAAPCWPAAAPRGASGSRRRGPVDTSRARLRHAREFERVFERGRRGADDCFTVIAAANGGDNPRLGLAISKRRTPRAVDRNRIKRIVRESFRHHAASLPAVDIVVLARSGSARRDNARLFASLDGHWRRLAADVSKG